MPNLQHVEEKLLHAKERLKHRKATLSQCYAHAGYHQLYRSQRKDLKS